AADALSKLEEEKQLEVAQAMSSLTEGEDMAGEIKAFLERKLKQIKMLKDYIPVMGYRVLADILSSSRYAVAKIILENMQKRNTTLAEEVRKRMFLFEDISSLDDKDIETLIHNISREMIANSLSDASDEVKAKFLRNMTDRAREMFEEDTQTVRRVEIEREGKELPFNEAMLEVDQNVIEDIFRTVDRTVLKMALRGASEQVREKFFAGLTERAVAMLKEDLEVMGSISRKRADEAQEEIMNILRQLSSKTMEAQHEIIATIRKLEREGQVSVHRFQEEMV
ncbi:MAG TPA: FliG C-terminal domain-containing protein, partial [bacterium]|nr:FliG C-terminal domain-containing protein [bacterium]